MKTKTPGIFIGILFFTGCQNLKEVDTTVYMDPIRPVEERVEALLEQMTLEEKIGQMDMVSEWDQDSIMKAGYYDFGAWIAGQEPEAANLLQSFSEKTRLKIPYLIGMDAAHGYATLQGRTVYPTSVSMAATFNRQPYGTGCPEGCRRNTVGREPVADTGEKHQCQTIGGGYPAENNRTRPAD